MLVRRLPVLLLLSVACAAASRAQTRRTIFSLGGNVRDDISHRALENIPVTLKQPTGSIINTAFTRDNGDFLFDGLTNGDYILEINIKDYQLLRENITISGASRMAIPIFLSRTGKSASPAMDTMSISAHQLSVPHKAHDEFEKGMALAYVKSDYRGAIAQFQLAIKDFPTYYEAYAEEGSAYYQLQDNEHAEESLRKSVELSSGQYADALFTLAALLTDTKRYADAETTARQGVSIDATSWRGPFELARALNALKRPEEAEKSAERSRDMMPDNPPVYLLLANIHIQRKDYPALLRDLDDYLRLSPLGADADRARKTRDQVQAMLDARKSAASSEQNKSQDDRDADDSDGSSDKQDSQPGPDTSGLPALPPPTPGNQ